MQFIIIEHNVQKLLSIIVSVELSVFFLLRPNTSQITIGYIIMSIDKLRIMWYGICVRSVKLAVRAAAYYIKWWLSQFVVWVECIHWLHVV
jgi:hypothetical protein